MFIFKTAADDAQADGDHLRQALVRGQLLASRASIAYLDEAMMDQFHTFDEPATPDAD